MSRIYTQLKCGCQISCDGGGGLMPCDKEKECQSSQYIKEHEFCAVCGECKICYAHSYECTGYDLGGLSE